MRGLDYVIKGTVLALMTVFVAITASFIIFRTSGIAVATHRGGRR